MYTRVRVRQVRLRLYVLAAVILCENVSCELRDARYTIHCTVAITTDRKRKHHQLVRRQDVASRRSGRVSRKVVSYSYSYRYRYRYR